MVETSRTAEGSSKLLTTLWVPTRAKLLGNLNTKEELFLPDGQQLHTAVQV